MVGSRVPVPYGAVLPVLGAGSEPTVRLGVEVLGALFSGPPKSPAPPPIPPPAATPATLAQASTNVAARNLADTEQLFGGTITNQGGAQGQTNTASDVKRSLLG